MQSQRNPFFATRLHAPHLRSDLVSRPHLLARLNAGITRKLTLITTSLGFGKTTLLSQWVTQSPLATAWISLYPDINNPSTFLTYLVAALETLPPVIIPPSAQSSLPLSFSLLSPALVTLLSTIANIPYDFTLVIDDYHLIDDPAIHEIVHTLLAYSPPQMHLIIASRSQPPFPLARIRGQGQITEITTQDLCFTCDETAHLCQTIHPELSPEDRKMLQTDSEGWITGLHLALLSIQKHNDPSSFIMSLSGRYHYIFDYLSEEVFYRQQEPIQTFLLHTSILKRLTGSLCDAVTGTTGSQSILAQLEQANLFIIALDKERGWYRYHRLFADVLAYLLDQNTPALLPELHRRASQWYEQNEMLPEAVTHALSSGNFTRVTCLAEHTADAMWMRGELPTLLAWLKALPDDLVSSRPRLCIFYAWALYVIGQVEAAVAYLHIAERTLNTNLASIPPDFPLVSAASSVQHNSIDQAELQSLFSVVRTSQAIMLGDGVRTLELGHFALEHLSKSTVLWRSVIMLGLGFAYQAKGDLIAASRNMSEACKTSQISGNAYTRLFAMSTLAQLQGEQGLLTKAVRTYRQVIQAATAGEHLSAMAGWAYVGLSDVCREWNNLDEATALAKEGIVCGELAGNESIIANGYTSLARLKLSQGLNDDALDYIQKAEQLARACKVPLIASHAAATQAKIWLARGNLDVAVSWAREAQLDIDAPLNYAHEVEHIILARVLLAQGEYNKALSFLHRLQQAARVAGRTRRVIEILLLKAIAHAHKQNDPLKAMPPLKQALLLAQTEEYIRIFVDEGRPLASLLLAFQSFQSQQPSQFPQYIRSEYLEKLLMLLFEDPTRKPLSVPLQSTMKDQPLQDALSERELEVLHLIGSGMSNYDIAKHMFITVGTAKWHLNNIYSKLHVHSRTQALLRARNLKLLP